MLSAATPDIGMTPSDGERRLRVLVLHSRYASGAASGENRVVEDEVALLRGGGHQVELYSPEPRTESIRARADVALGAVWNRRAADAVAELVRSWSPDIIHAHNLFPALSPAVLRQDVPTVVTLHNYRMLCLPADFLRDGVTCEDCLGKAPWRGVMHRCYRGSALGSSALAASLMVHRRAGSFGRVATFLAVSDFVREKHIQAGWPAERITVHPNFAATQLPRTGPGEYFVYVGRLSPEKGLDRLVTSWDVAARLVIVGDGEEREKLTRLASGDVEFRGVVPPSAVPAILRQARALVLPSICYEGAPRTVVEAFAVGVPVIASATGSLPDTVGTAAGITVAPGDGAGWRTAAERLLDDGTSVRLGHAALATWRKRFSPDRALRGLEEAYRSAITMTHTATKGGSRT